MAIISVLVSGGRRTVLTLPQDDILLIGFCGFSCVGDVFFIGPKLKVDAKVPKGGKKKDSAGYCLSCQIRPSLFITPQKPHGLYHSGMFVSWVLIGFIQRVPHVGKKEVVVLIFQVCSPLDMLQKVL